MLFVHNAWSPQPHIEEAALVLESPTLRIRCSWCGNDPLYQAYHDEEWGVPCHDDRKLFELLTLEGAQAGLSWITILRKRDAYRRAFAEFDPAEVADFSAEKVQALLLDPGLVRNRLKVGSTIGNAQAILALQREFGTFDAYLWSFVGGAPRLNGWPTLDQVPARTPQADILSKDLKRRGFRFVGPTIMYAFMQATGMVDDHVAGCWRFRGQSSQPG